MTGDNFNKQIQHKVDFHSFSLIKDIKYRNENKYIIYAIDNTIIKINLIYSVMILITTQIKMFDMVKNSIE